MLQCALLPLPQRAPFLRSHPCLAILQHPVHVPAAFPNMVHPSLQRESTFRKLSAETNFFAL